jgi:pimeloyl-ACP methyl ester carboxylesterase
VAHVVADLGVRRGDVRADGGRLRQSRLRRGGHSLLRHRYGLAPGDPRYAAIEAALAAQPPIAVPAITIDGDADGVNPGTAHHAKKFAGPHQHRIFKGAGHNLPQERPEEWARAVIDARAMALG